MKGLTNGKSYGPLSLALLPTENQIFMACLDAHLYEIEYITKLNTKTTNEFNFKAAKNKEFF
jgi:hypothetical protein